MIHYLLIHTIGLMQNSIWKAIKNFYVIQQVKISSKASGGVLHRCDTHFFAVV